MQILLSAEKSIRGNDHDSYKVRSKRESALKSWQAERLESFKKVNDKEIKWYKQTVNKNEIIKKRAKVNLDKLKKKWQWDKEKKNDGKSRNY